MKKLLLLSGVLGFTFLLAKSNNNLQPIPPADNDNGGGNQDAVDTIPVAPPKGTLTSGPVNNGGIIVTPKPTGLNNLPKSS